MIIVLSGPAGVGKTTIARLLLRTRKDITRVVTMTSRKPRRGEKNGIHYIFTTAEEIQKLSHTGKLFETAYIHENWYGTPREKLDSAAHNGTQGPHVLLVIDYHGMRRVKQEYGNNAVSIWLQPEFPEKLLERLQKRRAPGGKAEIQRRLESARDEIQHSGDYDVILTNWEGDTKRTLKDLLTKLPKYNSL